MEERTPCAHQHAANRVDDARFRGDEFHGTTLLVVEIHHGGAQFHFVSRVHRAVIEVTLVAVQQVAEIAADEVLENGQAATLALLVGDGFHDDEERQKLLNIDRKERDRIYLLPLYLIFI